MRRTQKGFRTILFKKNRFSSLSFGKNRLSGKNSRGQTVVYHRGGGVRKVFRFLDFYKYLWNVSGLVIRLEHDPNRNSVICLVLYTNGIFTYSLATKGTFVGSIIKSMDTKNLCLGDTSYLSNFKPGSFVHSIALYPFLGGQYARAAGSSAKVISHLRDYTTLKLRSHVLIKLPRYCIATKGLCFKFTYANSSYRKASFYRYKGWRPHVRGVAMNPIDHPHGGGEGRTSGGRVSVSKWGKMTKGLITRNKRKNVPRVLKR